MKVWVVTRIDYGGEDVDADLEGIFVSEAAVERYAKDIARQNPTADWRKNRRGYGGAWSNNKNEVFDVKPMEVLS
jgi:hypothetical protein